MTTIRPHTVPITGARSALSLAEILPPLVEGPVLSLPKGLS